MLYQVVNFTTKILVPDFLSTTYIVQDMRQKRIKNRIRGLKCGKKFCTAGGGGEK